MGLENKTQTRTATMQAVDDCFLGYIHIKYYSEFILFEKQKIAMKDLTFISENFFFKNIPPNIFKTKYYSYFILSDYAKGDYLFKENSDSDFFYFIKEGEVHLSMNNVNIREMNDIIKKLCEKIKQNDDLIGKLIIMLEWDNYSELELNRKRKVDLFFYGTKQILGVEEHCYDLKRNFSAKIITDKNKIFRISNKVEI